MSRGALIPTSVALVEKMREAEFSRRTVNLGISSKTLSVSRIRSQLTAKKNRLLKVKGVRKIQAPLEFMKTSELNPRTMLVLTETFLREFNKKDKFTTPKNALHVQEKLRVKLGTLPKGLIQKYSNWVYSFTQSKGNRATLAALRKKILQGKLS